MGSWHLNTYCFSFCTNVSTDCALSQIRWQIGKLFQILALMTAKFCVPSLVLFQWQRGNRTHQTGDVVGWQVTSQVNSQRPDMEAPVHADTCELEASGAHAGQVWCGHTFWSLLWHELWHSEQIEFSLASRQSHHRVNCYGNLGGCWWTHALASLLHQWSEMIWPAGVDTWKKHADKSDETWSDMLNWLWIMMLRFEMELEKPIQPPSSFNLLTDSLFSCCLVPSDSNWVLSAFILSWLLLIHTSICLMHEMKRCTVVDADVAGALMYTCVLSAYECA